jgi:L-lactate dehydrogenase (cytochrome)
MPPLNTDHSSVDSSCNNKIITAEEVAEHSNVNDCWLIIGGNVYDVTNFQNSHPGGKDIIVKHAGHDCTSDFESIGMFISVSTKL